MKKEITRKTAKEVADERKLVQIKTLQIKEGDLLPTNRGWKKAMSDAYLNEQGIICVEIKTFGEWKYMSHDQTINVKR